MPIFGQVWLWSSLAFLLGALLCWALVALPARRRVGELESELAARTRRHPLAERLESRRPAEEERDEYDRRTPEPASSRDEVENEPLTRAYALTGARGEPPGARGPGLSAPPETDTELSDGPGSSATQYLDTSGSSQLQAPPEVPAEDPDRGWFGDDEQQEGGERDGVPAETAVLPQVREPEPVDRRLVDDDVDDSEDGGTVFTQRTHPIPGELIRRLDESSSQDPAPDQEPDQEPDPERESAVEPAEDPADALVDDLEDEPESPAEQTILAEPVATGESKHQLRDDPAVTSTLTPTTEPASESQGTGTGTAHGAHDRTEVVPAHTAEEQPTAVSASGRQAAASDQSTPGTEEPKSMPGVTVQAEPPKNQLPKRVPSKPPRRTPFGVQTTSPATPPPAASEPTDAGVNDAPRSLFEPIVPAGDGPTVPPPHRVRGEGNGRGPFGPGSAMPLPGGGSPGPEFTVKASVSAMRYCTSDSEKFDRTVAEVWFRSAADAERVGFRPAG